jgi:hypothetical protein
MPAFLTPSDIPCRNTLQEQHLPKEAGDQYVSLAWFLPHGSSLDDIDISDEVFDLI